MASTFSAFTSHAYFQATLRMIRNLRISPVASYIAYKSSGYGDQGPLSGMSISDFVAVWAPYNNNGPPTDIMGTEVRNVRYVYCFPSVSAGFDR